MKKIKSFLFILLFLVSACGYKALNNLESYNFKISKYTLNGEKKVNNILEKNFKKFFDNSDQENSLKIEVDTKLITSIVSKNNAGEPIGYEMNLTVQVNVIRNNKLLSNVTFNKNTSYDNLNSKFELKQYENILLKDLTEQIVLQINNHIASIT